MTYDPIDTGPDDNEADRAVTIGSIGNSGSDVSVTDNLEMNDNEAKNLVLHQVSGDPSTPVTGQIWYDTSAD